MTVWGKLAFKSLRLARILMPMRAAAIVSGGDRTVASSTRDDNPASRSGAPPAAKIVIDERGGFHSLSASATARSVEPPKLRMPIYLPTRSAGLRISFCAMKLKGNLLSAARSEERRVG